MVDDFGEEMMDEEEYASDGLQRSERVSTLAQLPFNSKN